jgi:outer membrane protein assembly factor BamB
MLLLLEPSSLRETYRIALPESTNSSPAVYQDSILIVDQRGELLRINPQTGEITLRIQSNALQPVGIAPSIVGDGAIFAGRDGTTVHIDLKKNEKKWEKKLDLGGGNGIFQDIGASEKGVYPFTGTQFYALDRESGKTLFNPVHSTCPPLYHDGKLYFGDQQKRFLILDALSGKILKTYPLESAINLEPAVFEGDIVVATQSGTIYRLRPPYM